MFIQDMETHFPGESYTNEELRGILRDENQRITDLISPIRGEDFEEVLERPSFFANLGVEKRNLLSPPDDIESWWEANAGKDPFSTEAAIAYEKLMENHEPLGPNDRIIVTGNTIDTIAPNMGYSIVTTLQKRNPGFVMPLSLCLTGEGCAGFISALREASYFLQCNPSSRVVILTVEMMGTALLNPWVLRCLEEEVQSNPGDKSLGGRALGFGIQRYLFGDGIAAALCTLNGPGMEFTSFGRWANLDPEDRHLLENIGLSTKKPPHYPPFGFFAQNPKRLFSRLVTSYLPPAYEEAMKKPRKNWAVHTGSGKILDFVQQALGMSSKDIAPSRHILATQGNMNSTTGAAILHHLFKEDKIEDVFAVFFGVGFNLQTATF